MIRLLFLLLAFVAQPAYNSLTQKTADKLFFCGGFNVYPKKRDLLQTHAASQAWETLIVLMLWPCAEGKVLMHMRPKT